MKPFIILENNNNARSSGIDNLLILSLMNTSHAAVMMGTHERP